MCSYADQWAAFIYPLLHVVCVAVTQPSVFTPPTVKRRKRRVPTVHDTTDPDAQPMSSDDYAASSANISSSSSSNEEDISASCEQHVVSKEVLSDRDSASVFWIPNSVPPNDGFVNSTSTHSKDSPIDSCPLLLGEQKVYLGQCSSDPALVLQNSRSLTDDIDLTVGSDTFMEAGSVEELQSSTQLASLPVASSQEVQEQSVESEDLSLVLLSDRHMLDSYVEHVSNEDGDDSVEVFELPGIENLVAVEVEHDGSCDVVGHTVSQEIVKEDILSVNHPKSQKAEVPNECMVWSESNQLDDEGDDDDDTHLHVSRPTSQRIAHSQTAFEPLTSNERTTTSSLSQLYRQSLYDTDSIENSSVLHSRRAGQIDCGSCRRRTVSMPELTLVSAEARSHIQQMLESALCGKVHPRGTHDISGNCPHWPSVENVSVSVTEGCAVLPVSDATVYENLHSIDVMVGLPTGGSDSICHMHPGPDQIESYELDFAGQHKEQQKKLDATALLQDDAEQLSLPEVTSISHIADSHRVTDGASDLHPELDVQEKIITSCQSDDQLKRETHADRQHLDTVCDITDRDQLHHLGGDRVELFDALLNGKLFEDFLPVSSTATDADIYYTVMEDLTGLDDNRSSAEWREPNDEEDRCLGVVANREGSCYDVTVSVTQLQQLADVVGISFPAECVGSYVDKSENGTHHMAEVFSHQSEMLAEAGDTSYVTAREEVLPNACTNVCEVPSGKSLNAATDTLPSVAQMGREMQQLAVCSSVGAADRQRTADSSAIEVTVDAAVTAPLVHSSDVKMPESGTDEANQAFATNNINPDSHLADERQLMCKSHNTTGLHDIHVRETDDWIDADVDPDEDMVLPMHIGATVEAAGIDEQAFFSNGDRECHVEASFADGNIISQLVFRSESTAYQSITEESNAKEESTSSETQSATWEVSGKVSYVSVGESTDIDANDKENRDGKHLLASETADMHASVTERAVVEAHSGTGTDDSEDVHSFDDGMSSELLGLDQSEVAVDLLLDQLTLGTETSRETALKARDGCELSEVDEDEVDNTEPRPSDVAGSIGGNFLEQSGSTVFETADSSLQVSTVNMTDSHEFDGHLLKGDESSNMSPITEAAEDNHQRNSVTVLSFENTTQYENSHLCICPLGMTEDSTAVNVHALGKSTTESDLVSSINDEFGTDSDPCAYLNSDLYAGANEHDVNMAGSYSEETREPHIDINTDSSESAEPLEEFEHNEQPVFPADGSPVSASHTPGSSSVSCDHLYDALSGSKDCDTRKPPNDSRPTIPTLEPVASGFWNKTMTDSSESEAQHIKSRSAVELDAVNTEVGNLAAVANIENRDETTVCEQKAVTVIATCDSSTVIDCAVTEPVVDRPAVFLLENSNDDAYHDIAEIEKDYVSDSGELNASGCSTVVDVVNSSLPVENVLPVFDHCASFGSNLVCHVQSTVAVVRPEENGKEIGSDMSTKVVIRDYAECENVQVLTSEFVYDIPMTSVVSETVSDHKSAEAVDSIQSEISGSTQSSWDLSTAVVTDGHRIVEPLNTLSDIVLKAEFENNNNEQHEFSSEQEPVASASVPSDDAVRKVVVALQNEWAVFETDDGSKQQEIVQIPEFSAMKHCVPVSSIASQSELSDYKEAVSAELVLADSVRSGPMFTDDEGTLVDIADIKDNGTFGTQLEQALIITDSSLPVESLFESVSDKPAVHEEHDRLLYSVGVAVLKDGSSPEKEQTDSETFESDVLTDIILASEHGYAEHLPTAVAELSVSGPASVTEFDVADLQADSLAERVDICQNDSLPRTVPESSVPPAAVDHLEHCMRVAVVTPEEIGPGIITNVVVGDVAECENVQVLTTDTEGQHEEVAAQCRDAGLCGSDITGDVLRFSKFHAIAVGAETMITFLNDEGINSSATAEKFDRERPDLMLDLDSNSVRLANEQAPGVLESYQCTLGSVEIQGDHLMKDDSPLASTVDHAFLLPDSDISVSAEKGFCDVDADMMMVADAAEDSSIVPAGITGDTNVFAVANTAVVSVASSTDSGLKTHTGGEIVLSVDSSQGACASESARNSSDLSTVETHVEGDDGGPSSSVVKSDETSMPESVSVADPQEMVESFSCLLVKHANGTGSVTHCDATEQTVAVNDWSVDDTSLAATSTDTDALGVASIAEVINEAWKTTSVLHNAATAAYVNFPWLHGEMFVTESITTDLLVSANDASGQRESTLVAAGGVEETEEYIGTVGQNAAACCVLSLTEPATLLGPSDLDVALVVGTSLIADSLDADPGTHLLHFRTEKLKEDATIMSICSQISAVVSGGDDGYKHLPEVICVEHSAEGHIHSGVSDCENEATRSVARVNNASSLCAAESVPCLAVDDIIDEKRHSDVSEQEPRVGTAVSTKQTELSKLPSGLDGAESWLFSVSSDADNCANDKETDHRGIEIAAEKIKGEQTVVFSVPVRSNNDSEVQNIAAGDEVSAANCSVAVIVEENSNEITESSVVTVVGTVKAVDSEHNSLQYVSDASRVATTGMYPSEETSDLRNNVCDEKSLTVSGVEPMAGDFEACNAVDCSRITPDSAVAVLVDRSLELPESDSETKASSLESHMADGSAVTLQRELVESLLCDGHDLGSVDHSFVTDSQDFTALPTDSRKVVDQEAVTVKNEKSSVIADRTAVFSVSSTACDSDSRGRVAETADTAVSQNLMKNSYDIEPGENPLAAADDGENKIFQQRCSLSDGRPATNQSMPGVIHSTVEHSADNVCGLSETALITVVDTAEQPPSARQKSRDDQRPASSVENMVQQSEAGIAMSIDSCVVGASHILDQHLVMFCHNPSVMFSLETPASLPVVHNKRTESQMSWQDEIRLLETTDAFLGHLSDSLQADGITVSDQTYSDDNAQKSLRNVSVLEEEDGHVEELLRQSETGTSPTCVSDDLDILMTEGATVGIVSASGLNVIHIDAKSHVDKHGSIGPSPAVVGDARLHPFSGHTGVLTDGTCRIVGSTEDKDGMTDDLMIAVCVQHDTAVASKEHLPLTDTQHQNHENEGICANHTEVVFNALSVDGECRCVNDQVTVITNSSSVEQLAATAVDKSVFYELPHATRGDDTSDFHFRNSAHMAKKNVAAVGLSVPVTQKTTVANFIGQSAGVMSTTITDEALDFDGRANDDCADVCAEKTVNDDVPVVADSDGRETQRSKSVDEMMAESNQSLPLADVGSNSQTVCSQLNSDVTAQRLGDREDSCRLASSQIQPHEAVSHPAPTENVRTGGKQVSRSSGAVHHSSSSSQATQSSVFPNYMSLPVKSVDCRVQKPRDSNSKKRVAKLTDTEVLGIDLEPERQCNSVESRLQQSSDVEVVMSGHSIFGLGQQTDFQYQSIGLQPVGTQRPRFIPGPEQVLRDEVAEQYPESFSHSALDIEIRPQKEDDSHMIGNDVRTHKASCRSDAVVRREVQDCTTVAQQRCGPDLLRVTRPASATNRETAGRQLTAGGESRIFNDSLAETLQRASGRNVECRSLRVNRESSPHSAASLQISHQCPASQYHIGRPQIYDIGGLDLFRCRSLENMNLRDVERETRLVRSHSDKSIISARRNCLSHRRRRLAQRTLADSSLSASDHELLGSTSTLFEDLLPNFKDLPFFWSLSGSNTDTEEDKLIGDQFDQVHFLPWYHSLPSVPGSGVHSKTSDSCGLDSAARIKRPNVFDMQMTAETDCNQPVVVQANDNRNSRDAADIEMSDDVVDGTQSMDSITYVFVGHDDNSLKAVGDSRCGMIRFSSEPLSYPWEATVDIQRHIPIHSHVGGVLTECSSENCLFAANTECSTPVQRSLSCTGADDRIADNGGFSDDFSSDVRTGHQQLCTVPFCDHFGAHNESSTRTLHELRLSDDDMSLPASGHAKTAVQTNRSLDERYAKQPLLLLPSVGRSRVVAETQTHHSHQLHHDEYGSHLTMKKSHTVQNLTHDDKSAKLHSTQSLPYRMDDQSSLSAEPVLQSSGRTVETQTYPEKRVIETQTPNNLKSCGTQTTHSNDVRNQDQIDLYLNVPLTDSGSLSSPGLHATPSNRPRSECLSAAESDVVNSKLMLSAANSTPIEITSYSSLENISSPVLGTHSSIHMTDPSLITATNTAVDQLQTVMSPETDCHATNTADMWSGRPHERSLFTRVCANLLSSPLNLSLDRGLSHKQADQTSQGGDISLSREGLSSSGSELAGHRRHIHNSTSAASTRLTSTDLPSGVHRTQTSVNDRRLLAVHTTRGSLQHSATLPELAEHASYGRDRLDVVYRGGNRPSASSSIQSVSNTRSPASNSNLEMVRTQESRGSGTSEVKDDGRSNLKAEKILEKYRMKRAAEALHMGNVSSVSSPEYDSYVCSHASSYSHVNDSGIVDSQHSLSPLTRTLLGCSETSCDKSTATEPSRRGATAGWDAELERLHRERQLIVDILTREVIPSRIQVELAEAHLSYLMGQTDALLQQASEPLIGLDFRTFCRARLEAFQRHIEAQIQQLETGGQKDHTNRGRLAANLDISALRDLAADARERHYSTDSPDLRLRSSAWSPSQREQFLLGIRREIVSATASEPVTPVHTGSRWHATQNLRRSCPNREQLSAHSSFLNLSPDNSVHEEEPGWCQSSLAATPASSLRQLDCWRHDAAEPSFNDEIDSLLTECQEARRRARIEIGRAMDAIQHTSPAWTSSPLSSRRYLMIPHSDQIKNRFVHCRML